MVRATALALVLLVSPGGTLHADDATDGRIVLAQSETFTAYDIQSALARAGYFTGRVDGTMGSRTRQAISAFQSDNGLPVTGTPTNSLIGELRARGYLASNDPYGGANQETLVSDVQAALRQHGYQVRVSGSLDNSTRTAIRSFQRRQGLPVTGQPSAELLALIEQSGGRSSNVAQSNVVQQIESRLANKGYDVGPIDGVVDSRTEQSIRTYQAQRGLPATGQPSDDLLADLRTSTVTAQSARIPQSPEEAAGAVLQGLGQRLQNR